MNTARRLIDPVASEKGSKRILIVDDETGYLLALKKILQGPAVAVDTAETAEAAKALLKERSYHVVIADVMLTTTLGEEGLEILRHVKNHSPGTRVIIVTAYGNSGICKKALAGGVDLFFEKPLSSRTLIQALKCWGIECYTGAHTDLSGEGCGHEREMPMMNHRFRSENGGGVLELSGELTIEHAEEIRIAFMDALGGAGALSMRLVDVTGTDLSFLQLLCSAHRTAVRMSKRLEFDGSRPAALIQTMTAAGFGRVRGCKMGRGNECLWSGSNGKDRPAS